MKITTSLVVASSLLLLGGCSKKKEEGTAQKPAEGVAATPPPPPPVEAPKTLTGTGLADKYKSCIGLINDGKFDNFRKDCVDDGYQTHDLGDGSTHKADDLVGWFQMMKGGMPDFKFSPQVVLVNGRNILAVELVTGTNSAPMKSPMGEQPATNKKVGFVIFHRLTINDANKATEEWSYSDPATMMSQLGVLMKEATPSRPAIDKGIEGAPIVVVTADDAKEKANLEAARKVTDAINAGKFDDVTAMMLPDAIESDQVDAKDTRGAKAIETGMKAWFGAFKGAKVSIDQEFAAGDYVVHLGKFSGNHDKDIGTLKKTGKDVNVDYAEVAMMKDGKIAEIWRFHSGLVFATQLGLVPPPGAAPAAGSAAPKTPEKK